MLKVNVSLFNLITLLIFGLIPHQLNAQSYVQGEVIVKLKSSPQSLQTQQFFNKAQRQNQLVLKNSFSKMKMYHFAGKPGQSVEELISDLRKDPNVEYAEPNYFVNKKDLHGLEQTYTADEIRSLSANSPYLTTGADIHVTEVWASVSVNETKPIVAIIDTGLDINHSVFSDSNAVWVNQNEIPNNGIDDDGNGYIDDVNGWNFVHNSGYMLDDDGHGTHVAGIVLSVGQDIFANSIEESKINIMPLKFLDAEGVGKTSDAINAIYYAIENGAKVLNNSWGGPNYSGALHEAIVYSYEQGVTFVAAAGNAGTDNDYVPMYPSSYNVPHVISVAATTDLDYLASFSNFGHSSVDLGSPGVFILSTIPGGGFGSSSGTSMAAPFISGVAAMMLVESPEMLGYQVKEIVFNQADTLPQLNSKLATEARVNAQAAVQFAKSSVVTTSQPNYSFTNEDRQLASSLAGGGGCGMVAKLYSHMSNGGGGTPGPGGEIGAWYIIVILGIVSLPLMFLYYLRSQLPEESRRHQRFKIDSEVKVKIGDKELIGSVSSISLGGVQLNTDALLEKGSIVTMMISSPDGKEQIDVNGHIVWSEQQKSYGVQFERTTESLKEKINRWSKSLKPT
ncbi:MAG: S8 family serine peptidase [Bdellovibrionaceae bacterium]|nr:S8 family serine peptidase [Pseudobdellovibrionaceae bacterium]